MRGVGGRSRGGGWFATLIQEEVTSDSSAHLSPVPSPKLASAPPVTPSARGKRGSWLTKRTLSRSLPGVSPGLEFQHSGNRQSPLTTPLTQNKHETEERAGLSWGLSAKR